MKRSFYAARDLYKYRHSYPVHARAHAHTQQTNKQTNKHKHVWAVTYLVFVCRTTGSLISPTSTETFASTWTRSLWCPMVRSHTHTHTHRKCVLQLISSCLFSGIYIEEILTKWRGDYDKLEHNHTYIQWWDLSLVMRLLCSQTSTETRSHFSHLEREVWAQLGRVWVRLSQTKLHLKKSGFNATHGVKFSGMRDSPHGGGGLIRLCTVMGPRLTLNTPRRPIQGRVVESSVRWSRTRNFRKVYFSSRILYVEDDNR